MLRTSIVVSAVVLLAGCTVTPEKIAGPDGQDAYYMKCGAGMDASKKCMQAAAQACPSGYSVIDRNSQVVPTQWGPASVMSMTVTCK
jgi:hypothetical protein